jgi:phosphoribosylaminoimidazole-succinocarboxamide synthase
MTEQFLLEGQARDLVEQYISTEGKEVSTQEILDSGAIPRLQGYIIQPGKVSDSIFSGFGSYVDKKTGDTVEFENTELKTKESLPLRLMVRTDRISTHDITRGSIPFKDQILAANHDYMRRIAQGYIGTSQFETSLAPTAVVIAAQNLRQIRFENVIRAYMAKSSTETSLFMHYNRGERRFCGHKIRNGLIANEKLDYIMDTPSTKSDEHDESVSPDFLIELGICTSEQYDQIRNGSLALFGAISQLLLPRGLIAVDTKTEHGINHLGQIVAQDEIWTLDSSRFWLKEDYNNQLAKLTSGEITELNPKSFSKEFARGFSKGNEGYTDEQRIEIAVRYIMGIQHLLGKPFVPDMRSREERVIRGLEEVVMLAV